MRAIHTLTEVQFKIVRFAMEDCVQVVDEFPGIPTADEYPMYGAYQDDALTDEMYLNAEIAQLWGIRSAYMDSINVDLKHQRAVDNSLGLLLHSMKAVLAVPGRSGKWSAWLKERGIARATADRMVTRYVEAFHLNDNNDNLLSESTKPEPTELQIGKLVSAVAARCEKTLTTQHSQYVFLNCLMNRLGLRHQYTVNGVMVFDPFVAVEEEPETKAPQKSATAEIDDGDVL